MVDEIDLEEQAFSPVMVESLGQRDEDVLREEYSDASGQGIKGTLLPNALPGGQGGSMGFNASDRIPITVDPDIAGATYVLEPDSVKQKEGEGPPARMPAGGFDQLAVRRMADTQMRKAVGQPQAMTGKEEPMAKRKTQTRRKAAAPAPTAESPMMEPEVNPHVPKPRESTELPKKVIAFDFGPPMGTMECRYHDIFREGNRLVLVWDVGCITASKYVPAKMENHPIKVTVGREREEYSVYSLGLEFTDESTDRYYIVLLIDMRDEHGQDRTD